MGLPGRHRQCHMVPSVLLSLSPQWEGASGRAKGEGASLTGLRPGPCPSLRAQPWSVYLPCPSWAQQLHPAPSCQQEDLALIKSGEMSFVTGFHVVAVPQDPWRCCKVSGPPCLCSRSLGVSPQNLELACEESAQESFGPRCLCPPGLSGSPQWAPTLPHTPGNRHTYFRTFNIYNCFGQPPFLVVQSPLLRPQDPTGLSRLTCSVSGPSTHRHAPGVGEPDICLRTDVLTSYQVVSPWI